MSNCPQCGGDLKLSERLKRYYCDDCGYKITIEDYEKSNEKDVSVSEIKETFTIEEENKKKENVKGNYVLNCPSCGGDFVYEQGEIYCKACGKVYESPQVKNKIKSFKKVEKFNYKIGFICPNCNEKFTVIKGKICCKNCDIDEIESLERDKEFNYSCPKCKVEYDYNEITGKIYCKICGYQPFIENKEFVVDEDKSEVLAIECDKCGSNSGYNVLGNKIICKSCGNEIENKGLTNNKRKKAIEKDGIVARNLNKKTIKCKNCGQNIEGFDYYKTEFCPSCGTINVVVEDEKSLRLEPNKVIPFLLSKDEILRALENYGKSKGIKIKTKNLKKVYIPFWRFHFKRAKFWFKKKHSYENENGRVMSMVLEEGKEEIDLNDIWIPGKEEFGGNFDFQKIDFTKAIDYAPEVLDVLTERYDVGTTEAEVLAKDIVYDYLYNMIWNRKRNIKNMFYNFLDLDFETFKNEYEQILIPIWQDICKIKGEEYYIMINGQSGEVKITGFGIEEKVKKEELEKKINKGVELVGQVLDVLNKLNKN